MGIPVLIMGESGSGKSSSLRNFAPDEIGIFNIAGKPLPFKGKYKMINNATYATIRKSLGNHAFKRYVIDDSQYLLAFEMFRRAKETGYGKFTDIALDFWNLINFVIKETPEDVIVYFLHHTEETDTGMIKAKTVGKMLDNQVTVEGMFSIVLLTKNDEGKYCFLTQSDGRSTAKSPIDMFGPVISNDLKFVDKTIREYWELNQDKNGEE